MGSQTKIEWTDATWNPIIGCSRVSEGCRNCYAEQIAGRFGSGKPTVYSGLTQIVNGRAVWTGKIAETKQLLQPLSWKQPKRIFVNSMSDLFHENVTDEQRDSIFAVMAMCPRHTFQVLTKRPERMRQYILSRQSGSGAQGIYEHISVGSNLLGIAIDYKWLDWPLKNVWLGVSTENQATADERLPFLLQTPAAVRFISAEPLLGPIDLVHIDHRENMRAELKEMARNATLRGDVEAVKTFMECADSIPTGDLSSGEGNPARDVLRGTWFDGWDSGEDGQKLDWVICGGESGPHARPMHVEWARKLRDECVAAGVPFFFKQWGEWTPGENVDAHSGLVQTATRLDDAWIFSREDLANDEGLRDDEPDLYRVGKQAAGSLLDGCEWKEFPKAE
jgi:protein gp37